MTEARVEHLKRKIEMVKAQMQELRMVGEQLKQSPDGQVSLNDPDARSMAASGRGTGIVGYNVQSVALNTAARLSSTTISSIWR